MRCYVTCEDAETRGNLLAMMRAEGWSAMGAAGWEQLRGMEEGADAVVLCAPSGFVASAEWSRGLWAFRSAYRRMGLLVVLVDRKSPRIHRIEHVTGVEAVLPPGSDGAVVLGGVEAAAVTAPLWQLAADAEDLRTAAGSPVVTALAALCRARPPFPSVRALAHATDVAPRTLARDWSQVRGILGCGVGVCMKDLVKTALILRATAERRRGAGKWTEIAVRVGVHHHTLLRASQVVFGRGLRDVDVIGGAALAARARTFLEGTPT